MADWNLDAADEYIRYNTLDNEDWFDADDDRKIALLNVSSRTLDNVFRRHIESDRINKIPDEAVYIFAATLAYVFNDTNKLAQQGWASMSIRGMSVTFKDWSVRELVDFIPAEVYDLIGVPKKRMYAVILG